ncbi:MAG: CHASE domain-containing protein [Nannocystaceae bacterium]
MSDEQATDTAPIIHSANAERDRLVEAGTLNWVHWVVVGLSLLLTLGAWYYAKTQVDDKISSQFDRESDQLIELVIDRMRKYEDGLWGGVGAIQSHGGSVDPEQWSIYSETLSLDVKYPGINGIGVIAQVEPDELAGYVAAQRRTRPNFTVHPEHSEFEYLPITHIEPIETNESAVGLDMAHETNRYTAARKARETGVAQITGPIVLVQDAQHTPGFLFYAPFYSGANTTVAEREENFVGIVYAPFIFSKLMRGVLSSEKRHVSIKISDGGDSLFDELNLDDKRFDNDPMFEKSRAVELYGRTWEFEIATNLAFRDSARNSQPLVILGAGIFIDSLLFGIFVLLSRASRRAISFADLAGTELREQATVLRRSNDELAQSNRDLERFAYVASHDLQEPLRMVASYSGMLGKKYGENLDDKGHKYLCYIYEGAARMQALLDDLLAFSRVSAQEADLGRVDLNEVVRAVEADLGLMMRDAMASMVIEELPEVAGDATQLRQVFQNLIANAIKFRGEPDPVVTIGASRALCGWKISVADNGIGISKEFSDRVFEIFRRLHPRRKYAGNGVGLAIVKRIIDHHRGEVWVESEEGMGATFHITLAEFITKDSTGDTAGDTAGHTTAHRKAA